MAIPEGCEVKAKRLIFRIVIAPFVVVGYVAALAYVGWVVGFQRGKRAMVRFATWAQKDTPT